MKKNLFTLFTAISLALLYCPAALALTEDEDVYKRQELGAVFSLPALFYIDISCRWQKGVNQVSIRIPYGRRTVAAPWAASSVQNGHLMQPFCFL